MALFRNKYRVESARLTAWDYSTPGYYFVTICAYDHQSIFGNIIDDKMRLNECGNIVWDEWEKTFEIRHELKPDEFVVMPNHFHCIVRIIDPGNRGDRIVQNIVETHGRASPNSYHRIVQNIVETHGRASPNSYHRIVQNIVETHGRASLPQPEKQQPDKPQSGKCKNGIAFRPRKSISSLFAGYKSAVTKRINELRNTPGNPVWQSRFYDHLIRNDRELFAIRQYIRYNPANWDTDRNVIETQETKTGKQPWFVYMG